MSQQLDVQRHGPVQQITFSRPEKKNALTSEMYLAFADALDLATDDDGVRAVVLTGSGDSFCAGNDLKDFLSGAATTEGESPQARLIQRLATFAKPLIGAVNGIAVGIGVTMLLHCDLVYGHPTARFKTGFADLGLVPEAGSTMLLADRVGQLAANELFMLSEMISADRALELGLITDVDEEVVDRSLRVAESLAAKPAGGLSATKALLRHRAPTLAEQINAEGREFARLLRSEEFKSAAGGFLAR